MLIWQSGFWLAPKNIVLYNIGPIGVGPAHGLKMQLKRSPIWAGLGLDSTLSDHDPCLYSTIADGNIFSQNEVYKLLFKLLQVW